MFKENKFSFHGMDIIEFVFWVNFFSGFAAVL